MPRTMSHNQDAVRTGTSQNRYPLAPGLSKGGLDITHHGMNEGRSLRISFLQSKSLNEHRRKIMVRKRKRGGNRKNGVATYRFQNERL